MSSSAVFIPSRSTTGIIRWVHRWGLTLIISQCILTVNEY